MLPVTGADSAGSSRPQPFGPSSPSTASTSCRFVLVLSAAVLVLVIDSAAASTSIRPWRDAGAFGWCWIAGPMVSRRRQPRVCSVRCPLTRTTGISLCLAATSGEGEGKPAPAEGCCRPRTSPDESAVWRHVTEAAMAVPALKSTGHTTVRQNLPIFVNTRILGRTPTAESPNAPPADRQGPLDSVATRPFPRPGADKSSCPTGISF